MLLCRTCTSCPVSNSQPNPQSWQRPTRGHHLPHEVITGQRRAISCGEITRAILVSMIAQTYCIFCTIIILKIHTGGKPRQCLLALMLRAAGPLQWHAHCVCGQSFAPGGGKPCETLILTHTQTKCCQKGFCEIQGNV